MEIVRWPSQVRRLFRLILLAFAVTLSVAVVYLLLSWIPKIITPSIVRRASIAFLIGLEICYVVALSVLLIGAPFRGAVVYRARPDVAKAPIAARGLLLGICSLSAIGAAELVVAWLLPRNQAELHRR